MGVFHDSEKQVHMAMHYKPAYKPQHSGAANEQIAHNNCISTSYIVLSVICFIQHMPHAVEHGKQYALACNCHLHTIKKARTVLCICHMLHMICHACAVIDFESMTAQRITCFFLKSDTSRFTEYKITTVYTSNK